jgi:NitT/TauT family transport system substrate-binding protein
LWPAPPSYRINARVRRFVAAHRELTKSINLHPREVQDIVRDELKAEIRADFSSDLITRAFSRMVITSEVSLAPFQEFVAAAQKVGFLRGTPDLSHLVEAL